MQKLIKNGELSDNQWQFIRDTKACTADALAQGDSIIPFEAYKSLGENKSGIAFWVSGETDASELESIISDAELICIDFPAFMDGRGFTLARTLREQYDYQGDIRATGNFIEDQIYYLMRCGFTSFALPEDVSADSALQHLQDFTVKYQAAIDEPQPLFRRRT